MTPLIATLSCHNGSFGYFCPRVHCISVSLVFFLSPGFPLYQMMFCSLFGQNYHILRWCQFSLGSFTPHTIPLTFETSSDTSLLPSCPLAMLIERKERLGDLGSGASKTTNAPSTAVGVQWFTPTGHALPDGPVGRPEWSVTVGAKSLPGPSSDTLLYHAPTKRSEKKDSLMDRLCRCK